MVVSQCATVEFLKVRYWCPRSWTFGRIRILRCKHCQHPPFPAEPSQDMSGNGGGVPIVAYDKFWREISQASYRPTQHGALIAS